VCLPARRRPSRNQRHNLATKLKISSPPKKQKASSDESENAFPNNFSCPKLRANFPGIPGSQQLAQIAFPALGLHLLNLIRNHIFVTRQIFPRA